MREIEYRDALNEAFDEELARDENVVALPADVRDARRGGRLLQVQTGVAVELLHGHGRD